MTHCCVNVIVDEQHDASIALEPTLLSWLYIDALEKDLRKVLWVHYVSENISRRREMGNESGEERALTKMSREKMTGVCSKGFNQIWDIVNQNRMETINATFIETVETRSTKQS